MVAFEHRPVQLGRYILEDVLAVGGMASVYRGRLLGPGGFCRAVAIKRMHASLASDPTCVAMFVEEARLACRVKHPNVVSVLDVVSSDNEPFLVMDYVEGVTLARVLGALADRDERMPLAIVSAVLAGVLHGLHAAHEVRHAVRGPLNIVHRDVSPQNIMLSADGTPRLMDFGIAKAIGHSAMTQQGRLKGKVSYMAPEQLRGGELTRRVDVFAASVVLWESLTSDRLFASPSPSQSAKMILEGRIEAPSDRMRRDSVPRAADFPTPLDAVVMRGLARDPDARFATARDMAHALEACVRPASAAHVADWLESQTTLFHDGTAEKQV